jgi:type I restriction enzyme, S subunit
MLSEDIDSRQSSPQVHLGDILTHRKEFIQIDDTVMYKRCRVQLHAKGIVLRDEIEGASIKTKSQQLCRADEFLVAEIDAKVGGYGIVPSGLEGAIVSSHYFLFTLHKDMVDPRFLAFYAKTPFFRDQVSAQGSTNYAAIRPQHVLGYTIPLPPLSEQRRIVGKIERLAGKIEEAQNLRKSNIEAASACFAVERARVMGQAFQSGSIGLSEAANLERGKFSYRPRNDPRFFGGNHPWIQIGEIEAADKYIRRWSQTLNDEGLAISRKFPKGTLLISIAATIGAVGILDFDCCVPDSIVAITPKRDVDSEFIYHYLGYLRTHLEDVAPQSAQKNINLRILTVLPFPGIDINQQRRIVEYLDGLQSRVDRLKKLQVQTAVELDALLPSILDKAFRGEL